MSASPAPNAPETRASDTADAGRIRLGAGLRRPAASRDDAAAVADSGRIRLGAGLRRAARRAVA